LKGKSTIDFFTAKLKVEIGFIRENGGNVD